MSKYSEKIDIPATNGKVSKMVYALEELEKQIERQQQQAVREPNGLYGIKVLIQSKGFHISSDTLDVEFTVPFDDDLEANEAEIVVYNLLDTTISKFTRNEIITITAGYGNDTGIIFTGRISKTKTKRVGSDKQTTIYAIDCQSLEERNITDIAYKKGAKASYILKDLIQKTGLAIGVFKIRRDFTYKDDTTVSGGLMQNIKKYAEVCGVSAYINKGKINVRYIKDGDNINFTVSSGTGLIDIPEEFEEEITAEDFKETIKGYNLTMLLQHRITVASIITLDSEYVKGKFRVRSGTHSYDGSDFLTEVTVI